MFKSLKKSPEKAKKEVKDFQLTFHVTRVWVCCILSCDPPAAAAYSDRATTLGNCIIGNMRLF
jgi:hypothetical protein